MYDDFNKYQFFNFDCEYVVKYDIIYINLFRGENQVYLIVGLGNPEEEYSNTRHNIGFDAINEMARRNGIEIKKIKFNSLYGQGVIKGEKVILLKPQTYMNLSGIAVRNFKDFYKIEEDKIIIIHDDIDIEEGTIKIRKTGGAGTHNGMKSVVQELGNKNFYRIRIGVRKSREK